MNKSDVCKNLAEKAGISSSQVSSVIDALGDLIRSQVNSGEKLTLPKLGTFAPKHRAARTGHNPQTGQSQDYPAKNTVSFRPAAEFQRTITQPSGHPAGPQYFLD